MKYYKEIFQEMNLQLQGYKSDNSNIMFQYVDTLTHSGENIQRLIFQCYNMLYKSTGKYSIV